MGVDARGPGFPYRSLLLTLNYYSRPEHPVPTILFPIGKQKALISPTDKQRAFTNE